MAFNYGPPPGAYHSRQPSYPFSGTTGAPGIGPPPGMDGAPGIQSQSPAGMPNQSFQPPNIANMPNINFNAPVIRMGVQDQQGGKGAMAGAADRLTSGQGGRDARGSNAEPMGNRNRMGLGAGGGESRNLERDRAAVRESMMALQPPTREEVARTIFIGGLAEGAPEDDSLENLLRCAGKLRRWTRARDADDHRCKFGFAEYEDVESLEAANEILPGLEVPVMSKAGTVVKDQDGELKKMTLLVVVDDQSKSYIEEWKGKRKEDDDARQFRMDGCRDDLRQCLTVLSSAGATTSNGLSEGGNTNGEVKPSEAADGSVENANVMNIPLTLEDELADIPAEMRATVASEIRAFRDRSNRRDAERLRQEEEWEQAERQRSGGARPNRLASPPPSGAPSGPASAANGIPVGPREKAGMPGAPLGPKGYRGAQLPSDYVNGVTFVSSNGDTNVISLNRDDDDASESDEELERRRQAKKDEELEKEYTEASRRWVNRERQRGMAQEREKTREEAERRESERQKETAARHLREWNDDEEARKGREEYYRDRSSWTRRRVIFREREERDDERDRQAEEREKAEEVRKSAHARGLADDFLEQTGMELEQRAATDQSSKPSGFKISLGSAAARTKAAGAQPAPRKAMADVEKMLEDEEDTALTGGARARPELKPLTDTSTAPLHGADLSDEERAEARRALAADIPTSTDDLFAYPVRWNYLTQQLLDSQIRPFVERKVVEYLGVQEDLLVEAVVDGVKGQKQAKEIVNEVEGALDEDAEPLVRKCWRLLVFATESEARGLN